MQITISTHSLIPPVSTLGAQTRAMVHEAFARANRNNLLFKNIESNTVVPRALVNYLDNIFYLIQHTPIFLRLAKRVALDQNDPQLADFFDHKIDEEEGHEMWAQSDLNLLSQKFNVRPNRAVTKSMRALVDSIRRGIEVDPRHYLAYIMLSEEFTVLSAPLSRKLSERCGFSKEHLTCIDNHAELDKEHVLEMVEAIDRFCQEKYFSIFERQIEIQEGFHTAFCNEVVTEAEQALSV